MRGLKRGLNNCRNYVRGVPNDKYTIMYPKTYSGFPNGLSTQESYTLPNISLDNYYPQPKYLIIGSFGPSGLLHEEFRFRTFLSKLWAQGPTRLSKCRCRDSSRKQGSPQRVLGYGGGGVLPQIIINKDS